jgi:hypothetical protein
MLKSEDRLTDFEARLSTIEDRLSIIAAAPQLKNYLRDVNTRARVTALFDALAQLENGTLEERRTTIQNMPERTLRQVQEVAPIESIINIARDLPSEPSQKWLAPIREPRKRATIAAALHPVESLPTVLRIRSSSGDKVHVAHRDVSGSVLWSVNVERGSFIEIEKAEWVDRIAASDDLRQALEGRRLDVTFLSEVETRNWLASACDGDRFSVTADFKIERIGESEPEPVATPVRATEMVSPHTELREYHAKLARQERAKRVEELAEAFKAAFPEQTRSGIESA